MIKPKLQKQNTMLTRETSTGLFPLQKVTTLKRKISESSSDDVFVVDSNERYSAFTPCRPSKRRRTSSNSSSTCSSASHDSADSSWLSRLMDVVSSTIHECKVRVSKVYPWPIGFSMQCKALLQDADSTSGTFGLMILCQRVSSMVDTQLDELCVDEDYTVVGGSLKPKTIKTGKNHRNRV